MTCSRRCCRSRTISQSSMIYGKMCQRRNRPAEIFATAYFAFEIETTLVQRRIVGRRVVSAQVKHPWCLWQARHVPLAWSHSRVVPWQRHQRQRYHNNVAASFTTASLTTDDRGGRAVDGRRRRGHVAASRLKLRVGVGLRFVRLVRLDLLRREP